MNRLLFFLLVSVTCYGQANDSRRYIQRTFNFSLAPGLGTNGINPGYCRNTISINATAGYSAGFDLFEISSISNFSKFTSSGLQISSFTNVVGGDVLSGKISKKEEDKLKSNFSGIQITGFLNKIRGDLFGLQISGGINSVSYEGYGAQIGSLNFINGGLTGLQVASILNRASYSDGLQAAVALNVSKTNMHGVQIASFNYAKDIYGRKSSHTVGLQIGIINFAKSMDGLQIGLINISSGSTRGTQIGLINFFRNNKEGVPIAPINIGRPFATVRLWINDFFLTNYGIGLGSQKIQNTLYFSHNPIQRDDAPVRGIGYGIDWISNHSENLQIETGVYVTGFKNDEMLNVLVTPRMNFCFHLLRGIYFTCGAGVNILPNYAESKPGLSDKLSLSRDHLLMWPSISVGILTR